MRCTTLLLPETPHTEGFPVHPSPPPRRGQEIRRHKVWVVHLLTGMLIEFLIIIRQTRPFLKKWHKETKDVGDILGEVVAFNGPRPIGQSVHVFLNILDTILCHEMCQATRYPIVALRKEPSRIVEGFQRNATQLCQRRTATLCTDVPLRNPNDPPRTDNSLVLHKNLCPLPGA